MDYLQLIQWLGNTDIDLVDHAQVQTLIRSAVQSLDAMSDEKFEKLEQGEEMLEVLEEVLEELERGAVPGDMLRSFYTRFSSLRPPGESAVEVLERQTRELADNLGDDQWRTSSFLDLEKSVEAYLDGGEETSLLDALDEMTDRLEQSYKPYRESTILNSELSTESYVGHKLLKAGMEHWLMAIEILSQEESVDEELACREALTQAEQGNRLLIAVQMLNAQVQAQAGPR